MQTTRSFVGMDDQKATVSISVSATTLKRSIPRVWVCRLNILVLTYLFKTTIVHCMKKKHEYRDLFPGALELMILKSLTWRPMHGYALAQRLKDISEDYLQIEEGSLYPALQRMLKAGWLETEMGLSARNRPVRIFKVTEAGRKHLEQELASVEKMFAGVTRVLALAGQ
jgi:PadR family transcriptional regulator, regulatory protein PadR